MAAWALGLGGKVIVRAAGGRRALENQAELPRGRFELLADIPAGDAALHCAGALRLAQLDVSRTRVTDQPFTEPNERGWAAMKSLDLSGTRVTDAALGGLNDTAVTDRGLPLLSWLARLRRLELRGTTATPDGISKLRTVLPGCRVGH